MNKIESAKIVAVIEKAYQRFYIGYTQEDKLQLIDIWQSIFSLDEYSMVSSALRAFISSDTKGFPPVPGQIKELIARVSYDAAVMSDMEAWSAVRKAIRNSNYHAREEFDRLPELIQSVVVTPENLIEWAKLNSQEVSTVIQSNFTKSYRAAVERQKELARMPEDIKKLMQDNTKQIENNK